MIKEHDRVVLRKPIPKDEVEAGDIGTVVHIYQDGLAYEGEFITLSGDTFAEVTLEADHVRPISNPEIALARELEY